MILDLLLWVLGGLGPYVTGVALGVALRAGRAFLVRRRLLAAHGADVRRGPRRLLAAHGADVRRGPAYRRGP